MRASLQYKLTVVALTVLVIGAALYLFVYVRAREREETQYHMRRASDLAARFEGRVEARVAAVARAAEGLLDPDSRPALSPGNNDDPAVRRRLAVSRTVAVHAAVLDPIAPLAGLRYDGATRRVWVSNDPEGPRFNFNVAVDAEGHRLLVAASSSLDSLLAETDPAQVFPRVVLVNGAGTVLGGLNPGIRIMAIDSLATTGDRHVRAAAAIRQGGAWTYDAGHTTYRCFIAPLAGTSAAAGDTTLVPGEPAALACFVDENDFVAMTRHIDTSLVIFFLALVAAVVLCWPLLRMVSADHTDRIEAHEVFLAACAAVLLAFGVSAGGSAVLAFMPGVGASGERALAEKRLDSLAMRVEQSFDGEVRMAIDEVTRVDRVRAMSDGSALRGAISANVLRDSALLPHLSMVFWADSSGMQTAKWAVDSPTSRIRIDTMGYFRQLLGGKTYAVALPNAKIDCALQPKLSATTGEYQMVIAMPAGQILARAVGSRGVPDAMRREALVGADFRPLSLLAAPLPTGYGVALLTPEGTVLLHSVEGRSLGENLLVETAHDPMIENGVRTGAPTTALVRYGGRRTLIGVRALRSAAPSRWRIAVFYDDEGRRDAGVATLLLTLAIAALYLLPFGVALVAHLALHRMRVRWLWPAARLLAHYRSMWRVLGVASLLMLIYSLFSASLGRQVIVLLTIPHAVCIAQLWRLERSIGAAGVDRGSRMFLGVPLVMAVPLGLHALAIAGLISLFGTTEPATVGVSLLIAALLYTAVHVIANVLLRVTKETNWTWGTHYVLAASAYLIFIGVVPGVLAFDAAYDAVSGLDTRRGEDSYIQRLHAAQDSLRARIHTFDPGGTSRGATERMLLAYGDSVHVRHAAASDTVESRLLDWLGRASEEAAALRPFGSGYRAPNGEKVGSMFHKPPSSWSVITSDGGAGPTAVMLLCGALILAALIRSVLTFARNAFLFRDIANGNLVGGQATDHPLVRRLVVGTPATVAAAAASADARTRVFNALTAEVDTGALTKAVDPRETDRIILVFPEALAAHADGWGRMRELFMQLALAPCAVEIHTAVDVRDAQRWHGAGAPADAGAQLEALVAPFECAFVRDGTGVPAEVSARDELHRMWMSLTDLERRAFWLAGRDGYIPRVLALRLRPAIRAGFVALDPLPTLGRETREFLREQREPRAVEERDPRRSLARAFGLPLAVLLGGGAAFVAITQKEMVAAVTAGLTTVLTLGSALSRAGDFFKGKGGKS